MAGTRANTTSLMHLDLKTPGNPDIDADLRLLQQLYQRFKALTCREPGCRAPLVIARANEHVDGWMPNAKGSQPIHLSAVLCKKCKKYTCVGCRKKPMPASKSIAIHTTPEVIIQSCCEAGNTFAIWALLSMFDEAELSAEHNPPSIYQVTMAVPWLANVALPSDTADMLAKAPDMLLDLLLVDLHVTDY